MMHAVSSEPRGFRLFSARTLAAIWAGFWVWFAIAFGIAENETTGGMALHIAIPALPFLLIAAIGWSHPRVAGWLLLLTAAALTLGYPMVFPGRPGYQIGLVGALLAAPPLIAGSLLVSGRRR